MITGKRMEKIMERIKALINAKHIINTMECCGTHL